MLKHRKHLQQFYRLKFERLFHYENQKFLNHHVLEHKDQNVRQTKSDRSTLEK